MPAHEAATGFPFDLDGLKRYDAIILSDIGTNTFLLSPDVWLHGKPTPNRLKLIREWTRTGGGLVMIGGYYSFQGIDGKARWRATPVEEALPVSCLPYDDRLKMPEGFSAPSSAPPIIPYWRDSKARGRRSFGANEVRVKDQPGVEVLAKLPAEEGGHPLLVVGGFGAGRSLAWTSDIGPHWLPASFRS